EREITLAETQRRGDRKGREKTLARSHLRVSASLRDNLPTLTLASFTCLARVVFVPSLRYQSWHARIKHSDAPLCVGLVYFRLRCASIVISTLRPLSGVK